MTAARRWIPDPALASCCCRSIFIIIEIFNTKHESDVCQPSPSERPAATTTMAIERNPGRPHLNPCGTPPPAFCRKVGRESVIKRTDVRSFGHNLESTQFASHSSVVGRRSRSSSSSIKRYFCTRPTVYETMHSHPPNSPTKP